MSVEMVAMGSRAGDTILERYTLQSQVEALEGEIGAKVARQRTR